MTEVVDLQEDRDHQLGRLFGADAIIKSGILFQDNTGIQVWNRVLDILFELAKKKGWLREQCGFILYQAVLGFKPDNHVPHLAQSLIDKLYSSKLAKSPEGIALWVTTQSKFSSVRFPRSVWRHDNPLDEDEVNALASILNESAGDTDQTGQRSSWSSNVHFAWSVIFGVLTSNPWVGTGKERHGPKQVSLCEFWSKCVDGEYASWILLLMYLTRARWPVRAESLEGAKILGIQPISTSTTECSDTGGILNYLQSQFYTFSHGSVGI